jgi:hypothetical protein
VTSDVPPVDSDDETPVVDNNLYLLRLAPNGTVPPTAKWESFGQMPGESRGLTGSVAINDQLYILGGQAKPNLDPPFARVDRFNLKTLCWERLADLPRPSIGPTCASPSSDAIYCVLPTDRTQRDASPLFARYDTANDSWSTLQPPPLARLYSPSLVALGSTKLLMFGGTQDGTLSTTLPLTYRYNLHTGTWSAQSNMTRPRIYTAGVTLSDDATVVVIGGDGPDGKNPFIDTVDVFHAGKWKEHHANLGGTPLSFAGAAVLPTGTDDIAVAGGMTFTTAPTSIAFLTHVNDTSRRVLPPIPVAMRSVALQMLTVK